MGYVNKVILVGNIGRAPETRYTPNGQQVTNFSLATTETWTGKDGNKEQRTEWHRIVVWNKLAEWCVKYLNKGRLIYLEGKLRTRSYSDKNGVEKKTTEIMATNIVLLGGRGDKDVDAIKTPDSESPEETSSSEMEVSETDDDIPF